MVNRRPLWQLAGLGPPDDPAWTRQNQQSVFQPATPQSSQAPGAFGIPGLPPPQEFNAQGQREQRPTPPPATPTPVVGNSTATTGTPTYQLPGENLPGYQPMTPAQVSEMEAMQQQQAVTQQKTQAAAAYQTQGESPWMNGETAYTPEDLLDPNATQALPPSVMEQYGEQISQYQQAKAQGADVSVFETQIFPQMYRALMQYGRYTPEVQQQTDITGQGPGTLAALGTTVNQVDDAYDFLRQWNVGQLGDLAYQRENGGLNPLEWANYGVQGFINRTMANPLIPQVADPLIEMLGGEAPGFVNWASNNPESVNQSYEQGYNGFDNGRAVWEQYIGEQPLYARPLQDIGADPLTLAQVFTGVAGAAIKAPRLGAAVRGVDRLINLPDDILIQTLALPFRVGTTLPYAIKAGLNLGEGSRWLGALTNVDPSTALSLDSPTNDWITSYITAPFLAGASGKTTMPWLSDGNDQAMRLTGWHGPTIPADIFPGGDSRIGGNALASKMMEFGRWLHTPPDRQTFQNTLTDTESARLRLDAQVDYGHQLYPGAQRVGGDYHPEAVKDRERSAYFQELADELRRETEETKKYEIESRAAEHHRAAEEAAVREDLAAGSVVEGEVREGELPTELEAGGPVLPESDLGVWNPGDETGALRADWFSDDIARLGETRPREVKAFWSRVTPMIESYQRRLGVGRTNPVERAKLMMRVERAAVDLLGTDAPTPRMRDEYMTEAGLVETAVFDPDDLAAEKAADELRRFHDPHIADQVETMRALRYQHRQTPAEPEVVLPAVSDEGLPAPEVPVTTGYTRKPRRRPVRPETRVEVIPGVGEVTRSAAGKPVILDDMADVGLDADPTDAMPVEMEPQGELTPISEEEVEQVMELIAHGPPRVDHDAPIGPEPPLQGPPVPRGPTSKWTEAGVKAYRDQYGQTWLDIEGRLWALTDPDRPRLAAGPMADEEIGINQEIPSDLVEGEFGRVPPEGPAPKGGDPVTWSQERKYWQGVANRVDDRLLFEAGITEYLETANGKKLASNTQQVANIREVLRQGIREGWDEGKVNATLNNLKAAEARVRKSIEIRDKRLKSGRGVRESINSRIRQRALFEEFFFTNNSIPFERKKRHLGRWYRDVKEEGLAMGYLERNSRSPIKVELRADFKKPITEIPEEMRTRVQEFRDLRNVIVALRHYQNLNLSAENNPNKITNWWLHKADAEKFFGRLYKLGDLKDPKIRADARNRLQVALYEAAEARKLRDSDYLWDSETRSKNEKLQMELDRAFRAYASTRTPEDKLRLDRAAQAMEDTERELTWEDPSRLDQHATKVAYYKADQDLEVAMETGHEDTINEAVANLGRAVDEYRLSRLVRSDDILLPNIDSLDPLLSTSMRNLPRPTDEQVNAWLVYKLLPPKRKTSEPDDSLYWKYRPVADRANEPDLEFENITGTRVMDLYRIFSDKQKRYEKIDFEYERDRRGLGEQEDFEAIAENERLLVAGDVVKERLLKLHEVRPEAADYFRRIYDENYEKLRSLIDREGESAIQNRALDYTYQYIANHPFASRLDVRESIAPLFNDDPLIQAMDIHSNGLMDIVPAADGDPALLEYADEYYGTMADDLTGSKWYTAEVRNQMLDHPELYQVPGFLEAKELVDAGGQLDEETRLRLQQQLEILIGQREDYIEPSPNTFDANLYFVPPSFSRWMTLQTLLQKQATVRAARVAHAAMLKTSMDRLPNKKIFNVPVILSDADTAILNTRFRFTSHKGKTYYEAQLDIADQIDALRAKAIKLMAMPWPNNLEGQKIAARFAPYGGVNPKDQIWQTKTMGRDWFKNALYAELIEIPRQHNLPQSAVRQVMANWGRRYDRFLTVWSQVKLLNPLSIVRYLFQNFTGNTFQLAMVNEMESAFYTQFKIMPKMFNETGALPKALGKEWHGGDNNALKDTFIGDVLMRSQYGEHNPAIQKTASQAMFGGQPGKLTASATTAAKGPNRAQRAIGRYADTAGATMSAIEQSARIAVWGHNFEAGLRRRKTDLIDHAISVDAGRIGIGLGEQNIRSAFHNLHAIMGPLDVRKQMMDLARVSGADPRKAAIFADRIARDWANMQKLADDDAMAATYKSLFSYEYSNADMLIRRVIPFHFWATRAIPFYAEVAIKNPYLVNAYLNAQDALEREAENSGAPDYVKQGISILNSPFGFAMFFNPISAMGMIALFERETSRESIDGESWFGRIVRKAGENFGTQLYPWFGGLLNWTGTMGSTNQWIDPTGYQAERRKMGSFIQFMVNTGIFGKEVEEWTLTNDQWFQQLLVSGRAGLTQMLPGIDKIESFDVDATRDRELTYLMMDLIAERDGTGQQPLTMDQIEEIIDARENGDAPLYHQAMDLYAKSGFLQSFMNSVVPGYMQKTPEDKAAVDAIGDIAQEAESEGDFAQMFRQETGHEYVRGTNDLVPGQERAKLQDKMISATPEHARLLFQQTEYYNLGTQRERQIADTYYGIRDGSLGYSITVAGRVLKPADLQALDPESRKQVSKLWMQEDPERQTQFDTYQGKMDAYTAANPEWQQYQQWRTQVGTQESLEQYRQQLSANNPNAQKYFANQRKRILQYNPTITGTELMAQMDKATRSLDAYEAIYGFGGSVFDRQYPTSKEGDSPYDPVQTQVIGETGIPYAELEVHAQRVLAAEQWLTQYFGQPIDLNDIYQESLEQMLMMLPPELALTVDELREIIGAVGAL